MISVWQSGLQQDVCRHDSMSLKEQLESGVHRNDWGSACECMNAEGATQANPECG